MWLDKEKETDDPRQAKDDCKAEACFDQSLNGSLVWFLLISEPLD